MYKTLKILSFLNLKILFLGLFLSDFLITNFCMIF